MANGPWIRLSDIKSRRCRYSSASPSASASDANGRSNAKKIIDADTDMPTNQSTETDRNISRQRPADSQAEKQADRRKSAGDKSLLDASTKEVKSTNVESFFAKNSCPERISADINR